MLNSFLRGRGQGHLTLTAVGILWVIYVLLFGCLRRCLGATKLHFWQTARRDADEWKTNSSRIKLGGQFHSEGEVMFPNAIHVKKLCGFSQVLTVIWCNLVTSLGLATHQFISKLHGPGGPAWDGQNAQSLSMNIGERGRRSLTTTHLLYRLQITDKQPKFRCSPQPSIFFLPNCRIINTTFHWKKGKKQAKNNLIHVWI